MIRRPPRSTLSSSSAASDVYKRREHLEEPVADGRGLPCRDDDLGGVPDFLGREDVRENAVALFLRARRAAERDVAVERLVLVPSRRLDGRDELPRDAE